MDIQLPVKSGIEATREIREMERLNNVGMLVTTPTSDIGSPSSSASSNPLSTPNSPLLSMPVIIVALTASSLQADRVAALAAGCNDFLTKPVSLPWLESKLVEWGSMAYLSGFSRRSDTPSDATSVSSAPSSRGSTPMRPRSRAGTPSKYTQGFASRAEVVSQHLHIERSSSRAPSPSGTRSPDAHNSALPDLSPPASAHSLDGSASGSTGGQPTLRVTSPTPQQTPHPIPAVPEAVTTPAAAAGGDARDTLARVDEVLENLVSEKSGASEATAPTENAMPISDKVASSDVIAEGNRFLSSHHEHVESAAPSQVRSGPTVSLVELHVNVPRVSIAADLAPRPHVEKRTPNGVVHHPPLSRSIVLVPSFLFPVVGFPLPGRQEYTRMLPSFWECCNFTGAFSFAARQPLKDRIGSAAVEPECLPCRRRQFIAQGESFGESRAEVYFAPICACAENVGRRRPDVSDGRLRRRRDDAGAPSDRTFALDARRENASDWSCATPSEAYRADSVADSGISSDRDAESAGTGRLAQAALRSGHSPSVDEHPHRGLRVRLVLYPLAMGVEPGNDRLLARIWRNLVHKEQVQVHIGRSGRNREFEKHQARLGRIRSPFRVLIDDEAPLTLPSVGFVEDERSGAVEYRLRGEEVHVGPAGVVFAEVDDFSPGDEKFVSSPSGEVGIEVKIGTRYRSGWRAVRENVLPRRRDINARKWREGTVVIENVGYRRPKAERHWAGCRVRQCSELTRPGRATLLQTRPRLTCGLRRDRRRRVTSSPEVPVVCAPAGVRLGRRQRVLQRFRFDGPAWGEEGSREARGAGRRSCSDGVHRSPCLEPAACVRASAKDVDAEVDVVSPRRRHLFHQSFCRLEVFFAPPVVAKEAVARLEEGEVELVQAILPLEFACESEVRIRVIDQLGRSEAYPRWLLRRT